MRQPQPTSNERRQRARSLAAMKRRLFLTSTALALAYPAALWLSGLFSRSWDWLLGSGWPSWGALAAALAAYGLGQGLMTMPLSYYGGYVIGHRYGLSRQRQAAWLADWAKGMGVGLALAVALGLLFFWLLQAARQDWWWIYGLALIGGLALMSYVAPYVLVPMFYRMRPLENRQLAEHLQALVARAGVRVSQICSLDFSRKTAEANAAVIGLGPSRRIVIADTLLESFDQRELESVVAHELGHHVHHDVPRLVAIEGAVLVVGLALAHWLGLPLLQTRLRLGVEGLPTALPLLVGAAQVYLLAALPVTNALSRAMEASADRFALALTGDGPAFIAAMRKLASQNLVEEQPPRWVEWLLYTHPPIAQRIAVAERWRGQPGKSSRG